MWYCTLGLVVSTPCQCMEVKDPHSVDNSWFLDSLRGHFCYPFWCFVIEGSRWRKKYGYRLSGLSLKTRGRGEECWVAGKTHQTLLLPSWLSGDRITSPRSRTAAAVRAQLDRGSSQQCRVLWGKEREKNPNNQTTKTPEVGTWVNLFWR